MLKCMAAKLQCNGTTQCSFFVPSIDIFFKEKTIHWALARHLFSLLPYQLQCIAHLIIIINSQIKFRGYQIELRSVSTHTYFHVLKPLFSYSLGLKI